MPIRYQSLSPDNIVLWTEKELYDMYIAEGVKPKNAKKMARACHLQMHRLNTNECNLWKKVKAHETNHCEYDES